ncbi:MAG TPA: septal ring lytic transglycosylase RlpA family protein [Terriglobales bacterium]|nr:septal ring lytic transglycosylase RlpA family protein [Terriglobales bacterium]
MKPLTLIFVLLLAIGFAAWSGASIESGPGSASLAAIAVDGSSMAMSPGSRVLRAFAVRGGSHPIKIADLSIKPARMGVASWYGLNFNGRKTASGEIFDDRKMTAAHKTLPLGTRVKVIDVETGKSVKVIINDRGPYVDGRIIDLSHAAAVALGIVEDGLAKVKLKILPKPDLPGAK